LRIRKKWTGSRKFTQIPSIWKKKILNIGLVDTEIALLIVKNIKKRKKEEINASKIYSPSRKFAEWAK